MPLRNFLFLDTKALDDYLSTLEGGLIEGTIDQTESGKRDKGGKISAKFIEGNLSANQSVETKYKAALTDAAKFQRLYELLENPDIEADQLQVLDGFDENIWKQLRRGEVLEVTVIASLPRAYTMLNAVQDASPLVEIMTALGQDPLGDPATRTAFEGMSALGKSVEQKPVPLMLEAAGAPGFHFLANLPRQHLRSEVTDLEGEVTLFGTIQRIIPRGQQHEAFNLIPSSLTSLSGGKPAERQRKLREMVTQGYAEVVKGPAAIITPLAVYR